MIWLWIIAHPVIIYFVLRKFRKQYAADRNVQP